MIVKIATTPMGRMPKSEWEAQKRATYDAKDAKAFLEAVSDDDMRRLMAEYASPYGSIFGFSEDMYVEDEWNDLPANKDTANSYYNLSALLKRFASLFDARRKLDGHRGETGALSRLDQLGAPGIEVNWLSRGEDTGVVNIVSHVPLRPDECTSAFLEEGAEGSPYCELPHDDYAEYTSGRPTYHVLKIESRPLAVDRFTVDKPLDDLLNRFTKLMIHDATLEVEGNEIYLQANSVASSIWCAVLDASCEGHTKRCAFCGRLIVALDERRPRKFCGSNCNKNHQRAMKFRKLVDGGTPEEQAAKIAGMSLARCKEFWDHGA